MLPHEWGITKQNDDFGEDFVIEIFELNSANSDRKFDSSASGPNAEHFAAAVGSKFGIQLKTFSELETLDGHTIPVGIKISTLNYLISLPYPTFLVVCTLTALDRKIDFLPPTYELEYSAPNFFFVHLNSYSEVLEIQKKGAGQKSIRVSVPIFNRLQSPLRSAEHGHFTSLIAKDPRHILVERCRLLATAQNTRAISAIQGIYETSPDEMVAAEAILALALNSRRGDCTDFLKKALELPSWMIVTSALKCLATQKTDTARQALLDFKKGYWPWYNRAHARDRHSSIDRSFAYYRINHFSCIDFMLVYCAAEMASDNDPRLVDLLVETFQHSATSPPSPCTYVAERLLGVFENSSPALRRYIFHSLKRLVASETDKGRILYNPLTLTKLRTISRTGDVPIMIEALKNFYLNDAGGC